MQAVEICYTTHMFKEEIKEILKQSVSGADIVEESIAIDYPIDPKHGDYFTNIALIASKKAGKNPRELAEEISKKMQNFDLFEKVEVAGPGFINMWIKNEKFTKRLDLLSNQKMHFDSKNNQILGKKIVVEYTDPNPFKEFHIGHLYSNIVGESIARLQEAGGAEVWRADYFGDVGMHVACSIWGLLQKFAEDSITIDDLAEKSLKERIAYFGQAYAKGATAYKEDESAKEPIKEINFLCFKAAQEVVLPSFKEKAQVDYDRFIKKSTYHYEEIKEIYAIGREWSLAYFERIYERLGTKFSGYYPDA